MKLTIPSSELLGAMRKARSVVEKRSTIPILANVLLKADKESGQLSLRATDLDLEISLSVPADIQASGETTVGAELLFQFASKLPKDASVILEDAKDGAQIVVRAGRSRCALNTLPASDFPDLTVGEMSHTFDVAGPELEKLFGKVQFAISDEETRFYLNGIYFHTSRAGAVPSLRAVATDGHRLALLDSVLPEGAEGMPGIIVPRKAVSEVIKLVGGTDVVGIKLSAGKIVFDFAGIRLVSKLIDQTYPDYERVIPASSNRVGVLRRQDFAAAVDRVATINGRESRAMKVSLSKGSLALSSTSADAGSASEDMEADYDADAMDIGFNASYLRDILQNAEGGTVRIEVNDPGSPAVFRGEGLASAMFVLMPMRL